MPVQESSSLCPRCQGPVWQAASVYDDDKCIICGWRKIALSLDAVRQIRIYTGKPHIEDRYQSHRSFAEKPTAAA
ncbi:MAG: hypothetical protein MK384_01680 [SAR202 cluster bacterium]|nr:hypothetical protein [SAR202 cluster bacterium]